MIIAPRWLRHVLGTLLVLLAAAAILPYVVPLASFIPALQEKLSDQLGQPVHIDRLRLTLLPALGMEADGISIGTGSDLKVDIVSLALDPLTLFARMKIFRELRLESLSATQAGVSMLPDMIRRIRDAKTGAMPVARVLQVRLDDARIDLPRFPVPVLDGVMELLPEGGLAKARVTSRDGSLEAYISPDQGRFRIRLRARNWAMPVSPRLRFDSLDTDLLVGAEKLEIQSLNGSTSGGFLSARGTLVWGEGWQLRGQMGSRRVLAESVLRELSPRTWVSGRLDGDARFELKADRGAHLFDHPKASATFTLHDGVLHNLDLIAAAKLLTRQGTRGGQTRFDEFRGRLSVDGQRYRFDGLYLSSGLLAAAGRVDMAPDRSLAGRVQVALRGSVGMVEIPLRVSGTTHDPVLFPTTGAIAGAAAGTLLMGPGVGTGVGSKAGDFVERLLGGNRK